MHGDIGQMDSYLRMFDDLYKNEDDNPTIGLLLCSEKNEAIVKYSVLNDGKNLFASKYRFTLPTHELESLNRCSYYMFCLLERFTETRFCKYECYFCSKEDVLKYHLPKYPEFYLVPFSIISKIFKFKITLDLNNKK